MRMYGRTTSKRLKRQRYRRNRRNRRNVIKATEGVGSSRFDLNRYVYKESDTIDVGTFEARKLGSAIDLGTAYGERSGPRIWMDYVQIKLTVVNPNVSEIDCGWLRLCVIHNKFAGSAPTTGLFASETETRTPVDYGIGGDVNQIIKDINLHKFNVFFDQKYPLKVQIGAEDRPHTLMVNVNVPIKRVFTYNTEVAPDDCILPDMDMFFIVERQDGGAAFTAGLSYEYQLVHYFKSMD